MGSLEIRPVHSTGDLRRFIRLPVPALPRRAELGRAAAASSAASSSTGARTRSSSTAARSTSSRCATGASSAGSPRRSTTTSRRFQDNRWGWFGFFECEHDPEAAKALLDRAEQWLRGQGCDRMVGPADFTTNDECGVLRRGPRPDAADPLAVDPPLLPGAAGGRGHGQGDGPADVGAAHLRPRQGQPGDLEAGRPGRGALRGRSCGRSARRTCRTRSARFMEVYNSAWEKNWGFVPLTEREVRHYAHAAQAVPRRELGLRRREGRRDRRRRADAARTTTRCCSTCAAGSCPLGWAKFLWYRRKIDRVRVFALGVKPDWQHTGVAAKFYERHFDAATRTPQTLGRDGLDPRDEQEHEQGDGGDGRRGRAAIPPLRARTGRVAPSSAATRCVRVPSCGAPSS